METQTEIIQGILEKWKQRETLPQKTGRKSSGLEELERKDCVINGITSPPIIPTNLTVEDIVGDAWLDTYITHLVKYKQSGLGWGQYANKNLSDTERREFARIINELHDHGFYDPHVLDDKLYCFTMVKGKKDKKWREGE